MTEKRSNCKAYLDQVKDSIFILGGQNETSDNAAEILILDYDKEEETSNSLTNSFTMMALDFVEDLTFKKYLLL